MNRKFVKFETILINEEFYAYVDGFAVYSRSLVKIAENLARDYEHRVYHFYNHEEVLAQEI